MDEREYREGVEGSFPERQAAPQTDADKAALDRMDITDASAVEVGPSDGEDAPHVEEEDDTPLPEGGDEAMLEAQRYGFSPDEARILAANGLVTRIRTMRESLESRAASADSGQARAPAEKPVPDEAVSSDAGLAETVRALQRELAEVRTQLGRVPDALDDHIVASGRASVFGDARSVQPDSRHAENRAVVRDAVETLRAGLKAQGKAVPDDTELVRRAIAMHFGDSPKDARQAAVARRQGSFTSRPSAVSEPDLPHGTERAVAGAAAVLRKYGYKG